jgi:hypothetical protein
MPKKLYMASAKRSFSKLGTKSNAPTRGPEKPRPAQISHRAAAKGFRRRQREGYE